MVRLRSFRFQLLTAVNAAIVVLMGVFLVIDYRTEIDRRVAEKHAALEEEVDTLLPAIRQLQPLGAAAVQRYIDDVCGRMRDTVSPGHHIAVESDGQVLQAVAHHRASPEIFAAMRRAANSPTHQAGFGDERLLAASRREGNTAVYASEYVTHIRRAPIGERFNERSGSSGLRWQPAWWSMWSLRAWRTGLFNNWLRRCGRSNKAGWESKPGRSVATNSVTWPRPSTR